MKDKCKCNLYLIAILLFGIIAPITNMIMTINRPWQGRLQAMALPIDTLYCFKQFQNIRHHNCSDIATKGGSPDKIKECNTDFTEYVDCQNEQKIAFNETSAVSLYADQCFESMRQTYNCLSLESKDGKFLGKAL